MAGGAGIIRKNPPISARRSSPPAVDLITQLRAYSSMKTEETQVRSKRCQNRSCSCQRQRSWSKTCNTEGCLPLGNGWSKTWTFFEGDWHEGNIGIMGPRTHAAWLCSVVARGPSKALP